MTYTIWNYLLHRLERRVKMLKAELNDTNIRLNTYIADEC